MCIRASLDSRPVVMVALKRVFIWHKVPNNSTDVIGNVFKVWVMVDHLHSTAKQLAQDFLLKNLVMLEAHSGLVSKYVSISEIR